jgi:DNA-binding SARP family transcriptional activator
LAVSTEPGHGPRLVLLNAFELCHEGSDVALPVPAQRLLAFLALSDRPVLRDYVAGNLWLDATEAHAAGSLRSALFRLRQPHCELVTASRGRLHLASSVVVDVCEGVAWARRVLDSSTQIREHDVRQVSCSGDILPDWYEDWVALERERFRELRLHALEVLCARLTSVGRFGEAMEAGLAAVKGEPLRESAHRAVMRVHLAEGNRAEALEGYRRFRERLWRQLGLVPSARMHELLGHVRDNDPMMRPC